MIELNAQAVENVSGGGSFSEAMAIIRVLYEIGSAYVSGMQAAGATLSNYYGPDRALEIIAAGNMSA